MSNRISRRDMLKNVGVAGAAGALLSGPGVPLLTARAQNSPQESQPDPQLERSSVELLKEHEDYATVLEAGEMVVQFDRRYGSISSITRKNDPLQTRIPGGPAMSCQPSGNSPATIGGSVPAWAKTTYFACRANGEES